MRRLFRSDRAAQSVAAKKVTRSLAPFTVPDAVASTRPGSVSFPLLHLGWCASPVISNEGFAGGKVERKGPTSDEIKAAITGLRAVLGYKDNDPAVGDHSLAWDGTKAIDCSNGEVMPLENITLKYALILVPISVKVSTR
jgi:hypothetical protein